MMMVARGMEEDNSLMGSNSVSVVYYLPPKREVSEAHIMKRNLLAFFFSLSRSLTFVVDDDRAGHKRVAAINTIPFPLDQRVKTIIFGIDTYNGSQISFLGMNSSVIEKALSDGFYGWIQVKIWNFKPLHYVRVYVMGLSGLVVTTFVH